MTLLPVHDGMAWLLYEVQGSTSFKVSLSHVIRVLFPSLVISLLAVETHATKRLNTLRQDPTSSSEATPKSGVMFSSLNQSQWSGVRWTWPRVTAHMYEGPQHLRFRPGFPKEGFAPWISTAHPAAGYFTGFSVKIGYLFDLEFLLSASLF